MPELPEVEIAARQVERWCGGKTIMRVRVRDERIVHGSTTAKFRRALMGGRVVSASRRGKHVLIELNTASGSLWWIHLGMSGKLAWRAPRLHAPRHTRVEIAFEDGRLCFVDQRIFGRTAAGPVDDVRVWSRVDTLGPDAWLDVRTVDDLTAALGKRARPVKLALMDQKSIAGLGNIQASEALFRAGVHPSTLVSSMNRAAMKRLVEGMRASLAFTLRATEAEEVEYMSEGGDNPFAVYGRHGQACPRCSAPIEVFRLAARSTFYCPTCQPS